MLSIHIAVPPGASLEQHTNRALIIEAHRQGIHLKKPLEPTLTPIQNSMIALAHVMGIEPNADYRFFKVECETVPWSEALDENA